MTAPGAAVAPDADPRAAEAPPAVDDLSYFSRLEQSGRPTESLKPPPADPAPTPRRAEEAPPRSPAPAAAVTPPPAPPPAPAAAPPAPGDWAVQVAALNGRPEAEAVAKRLSAKGYAAYVVTPGNGTPAVFRVRIGPFRTRREADTMAARLEKEEQFKPWVTR
jgi:DedD protein